MNVLEYKNLKIDLDTIECFLNEINIPLNKKEYQLLVYLLSNKNKIFSRGELSNEIWKKKLNGRTVDITMSRLRKKLGPAGSYIKTRLGFGYGIIDR